MVSKKPYRRSLDSQQALDELRRCSGTQFDPRLVELFCEHVYPQVGDWAVERHESSRRADQAPARSARCSTAAANRPMPAARLEQWADDA